MGVSVSLTGTACAACGFLSCSRQCKAGIQSCGNATKPEPLPWTFHWCDLPSLPAAPLLSPLWLDNAINVKTHHIIYTWHYRGEKDTWLFFILVITSEPFENWQVCGLQCLSLDEGQMARSIVSLASALDKWTAPTLVQRRGGSLSARGFWYTWLTRYFISEHNQVSCTFVRNKKRLMGILSRFGWFCGGRKWVKVDINSVFLSLQMLPHLRASPSLHVSISDLPASAAFYFSGAYL